MIDDWHFEFVVNSTRKRTLVSRWRDRRHPRTFSSALGSHLDSFSWECALSAPLGASESICMSWAFDFY